MVVATVKLLTAGDCPICASSGTLLVLLPSHDRSKPFLFCPLCGVACSRLPAPHTVDEVRELKEMAPRGVALPSMVELRGISYLVAPVPAREAPQWLSFLKDELEKFGQGVVGVLAPDRS